MILLVSISPTGYGRSSSAWREQPHGLARCSRPARIAGDQRRLPRVSMCADQNIGQWVRPFLSRPTFAIRLRPLILIPALLLIMLSLFQIRAVAAWDYGDGRHGSFVLTTNATIEQLYQTVRLPSDPEQFDPTNPAAIPNLQSLLITDGAVLTANPWNGDQGGRIVLKVQGTLLVATGSSISVNGLGYRGGAHSNWQGESYDGTPDDTSNRNFGGGGGGTSSNSRYLPGGGGGYGTSGDDGLVGNRNGGEGGATYGSESLEVLYLGSGGGGGASRRGDAPGGNGGGAISLNAGRLQVEGGIRASGNNGGENDAAGGGGGSGGSIRLRVTSAILGTGNVTAQGGLGGPDSPGGNGGVGRIRLEYAESYSGETTPTASVFSDSASDNLTVITKQPLALTNALGSTAAFSVRFMALSPYTIQWSFKAVPIPDATNRVLALTNLSLTQQGDYSVAIANAVMTAVSSNAFLTVLDIRDFDSDGIDNFWEQQYGLNPNNPADANTRLLADGLTYLQQFLSGLSPLTRHNDGDGLSDYDELFVHGTNPLLADTDGDGMPDKWELEHGLDPRVDDSGEDLDHDGLTNRSEFDKGSDPRSAFSATGGPSDYERANDGRQHNRFYYDNNDRLVGAEYDDGLALGYIYDGNDNLRRQVHLSRKAEASGLPVLWSFLNGLTTNTPAAPFDDPDGDGWSNWQEWKAGTAPRDPSSVPVAREQVAKAIARLELPFAPTNWVVISAQMDGLGTEELIVGADGNASGVTNVVFVLNENHLGWTVKGIPIGPNGVTSLAFGKVNNPNEPAIYAGLRSAGGQGTVMEIRDGLVPIQTLLPIQSTNEAVFVHGLNASNRVVLSLADATSGPSLQEVDLHPDGTVTSSILATNWQGNGLGAIGTVYSRVMRDAYAQIADPGYIQLFAANPERAANRKILPENAAQESSDGQWYFRLDSPVTWSVARTMLAEWGSDLVIIRNAGKDAWLYETYPLGGWIGVQDGSGGYHWVDGSEVGYRNFTGRNLDPGGVPRGRLIGNDGDRRDRGKWGFGNGDVLRPALAQVNTATVLYTNRWTVPMTDIASSSPHSFAAPILQANRPNQTNSASLMSAFVSSQTSDTGVRSADTFELVEWLVADNDVTTATAFKVPLPTTNQPAGFALALAQPVQSLGRSLFTAEPDGRIFMWLATNATSPLERRLFDGQHVGHSWKGMTGVKMAAYGDSLAALRAVSTNPTAIDVFLWSPQHFYETPALQSWPQTAPAAAVQPSANPLGSFAEVSVRLWDAEGNASQPQLQWSYPNGETWSDATATKVDGSPLTKLAAPPTGEDHVLLWNAVADLGAGKTTNILLRARATDMTLVGDWSVGTPLRVETTVVVDNDSLPDDWELAMLQTLAYGPNDDPDGDGFTNLAEYRAGTDPRSAASNLALTIRQEADGQLRLQWSAEPRVPVFLEQRASLEPAGVWEVKRENPPKNLLLPDETDETYFRLRLGD